MVNSTTQTTRKGDIGNAQTDEVLYASIATQTPGQDVTCSSCAGGFDEMPAERHDVGRNTTAEGNATNQQSKKKQKVQWGER